MKSIGFFLAVFLSMLTVFLVATGEVKRWFKLSPTESLELGEVKSVDGSKPSAGNIFEFPFYDVNRAELKFVIRAEFIQDEFSINSQIDKIDKLTLRNGVIEVPFSNEVEPGEEPSRAGQSKKLTLEFQTALYEKTHKNSDGKSGLQIVLKQGKGTTDDGTRILFEELSFGEKGLDSYYLRSTEPVSIRNPSFSVMSPTGLEGTLRKHSRDQKSLGEPIRQELELLPPISALLNPESVARGAGEPETSSGSRPPELMGVTCQGPLSIIRESKSLGDEAGSQTGIRILFKKDVTIYPVPGTTSLEALPPAHASRFECQVLQVDLEPVNGRTIPVHGLATSEGGRVKGFFQTKKNSEPLVIDGDRLEWTRSKLQATAPTKMDPKHALDLEGLLESQATLEGHPVLKAPGFNLTADRAIYHPAGNRLLLEKIQGAFEYLGLDEKDGHRKRKPTDLRLEKLELGPWSPDLPQSSEKAREPRGVKGEPGVAARPPQHWDLIADEAEVFFADNLEAGSNATVGKNFSKFIARSDKPDGVQIKSRTEKPYQATGSTLTYLNVEKKVTLEGSDEAKPRFCKGENWIESARIHIFQEENAVWFDSEVLARIDDLSTFRLLRGNVEGENQDPDAALDDTKLEISSDFLAVRFVESGSRMGPDTLQDLTATGTPERPVTITTVSGVWSRFSGQELYWDQRKEIAQLLGHSGLKEGAANVSAADAFARIQLEDGELLSERIVFHQKTWKAYLSDRVTIRSARLDATQKRPLFVMRTGKSEVEFVHGLESQGLKREGVLKELGRIKTVRAVKPADGMLEISGYASNVPFVARAEEVSWSQESGQLRLHGTGLQEIELLADRLKGPTRAREIVFDEQKNLVELRGAVEGRILQQQSLPAAREVTKGVDRGHVRTVTWAFETNSLEAQLSPREAMGGPRLETIRARDKVDLRGEELGVQLRGDDLLYEEATKKIRVFSPDGRPQTLVCDPTKAGISQSTSSPEITQNVSLGAEEPAVEKVHKIVSQVITLLLYRDAYALPQRGDTVDWLLVEFDKDVLASFHVPPGATGGRRIEGAGDTWKMVAERLTLLIDPSQSLIGSDPASTRRLVPWAAANGKVVFSTGTLQATADKAVYQEGSGRVTLYGTPARLSRENEPVFAQPEISVWQEEGSIGAKYSKGDGRATKMPEVPSTTR